ncbi:MAG TPA: hypothetical protein VFW39_07325 [Sphingomicrobium sp.]|nr:hypothetical protein [Sphingomicrobium sp.]
MSGLGEAFAALKNVMLLHERMERVQKDTERLSGDLKDTNKWVAAIDRRVAHIEGVMDGFQRASAQAQRPRLPRK